MRSPRAVLILLAVALCGGVVGCGGAGSTSTTVQVETVDQLPKLAKHWHRFASGAQGFALGVAPGWRHGAPCLGDSNHRAKHKHKGGKKGKGDKHKGGKHKDGNGTGTKDEGTGVVVLCSPDLLTTVSITVDRSAAALDVPIDEFATRAFDGLDKKRYAGTLGAAAPHYFNHLYDGVTVAGKGRVPGSGFAQNVAVIVLRRDGLANFTVVIASNAKRASGAERRQAERMVGTLRDQRAKGSARKP